MTVCDDCGKDLYASNMTDDCSCVECGGDFCCNPGCAAECEHCKDYACNGCRDQHMLEKHGQPKLPIPGSEGE
jgi:hypothetical protein